MGDCAPSEGSTLLDFQRPSPIETASLPFPPRPEAEVSHNVTSPLSPKTAFPIIQPRRRTSFDIEDYFHGPRDLSRHSKWPLFMQMHGSIMPKMILPLLFIAAWSSAITVISKNVHPLGINSVLLTILGFTVSMGLSFRSSTAYERYSEGRKYWASLIQASQCLGRVFWVHAIEPTAQNPKEMLLKKVGAMNLVVAFAVALKHSLRFEPYTAYPDLEHLTTHLNTYAREATAADPTATAVGRKSFFKGVGEYLGVSFAESNPRKALKRAKRPLGNLPLEILNHIAATIDNMVRREQLTIPMQQTLAYNNLGLLNDIMCGVERVSSTPLPVAYGIVISQITYIYILTLPFQLVKLLDWVTIPATICASYIILGLLMIGKELESPFGFDVNDLPLDSYCEEIANDMDIIASFERRNNDDFLMNTSNTPLYPTSTAPTEVWMQRSEDRLRESIKKRPIVKFEWNNSHNRNIEEKNGDHNV